MQWEIKQKKEDLNKVLKLFNAMLPKNYSFPPHSLKPISEFQNNITNSLENQNFGGQLKKGKFIHVQKGNLDVESHEIGIYKKYRGKLNRKKTQASETYIM